MLMATAITSTPSRTGSCTLRHHAGRPGIRVLLATQKIQAFGAWEAHDGNGSIICAFVDTGVDLTHPDWRQLVPGYNSASQLTQAKAARSGTSTATGRGGGRGPGVATTRRADRRRLDLKIMPIRARTGAADRRF